MDKNQLIARGGAAPKTREVPIGDGGGAVTVRSLSRAVVKSCKVKADGDQDLFEYLVVSAALVDPVMTPEEVTSWLEGAPAGDSVAVMGAINELSGLSEEAAKRGVPEVRGRPRR